MPENLIEHLYILPILLFSVIIHEVAHGYVALKLGDRTAQEMGRLTLNPIPHIDLVGSIIVPLFSLLSVGTVFIAWAKPVPVNPMNFSRYKRDDVLVTVAGPLSNIGLALLCSISVICIGMFGRMGADPGTGLGNEALEFLLKMFHAGIYLNIVLAVFNLIPVPPLDGSHVLASLLPDKFAAYYRRVGFAGIFILIFLMQVPACAAVFNDIIRSIFIPFQSMINLFLQEN